MDAMKETGLVKFFCHDKVTTMATSIKTSFNYCSSESGQHSVILVVCDVPE